MRRAAPRRRPILYWSAVAVATALFGAGLVIAYVGYAASSGPDGVVRAYYAALQRGDAPDALAFGRVPDGAHALLTSRVLAEQQRIAPMTHVSVLSTVRRGTTATVHVRYTLGFSGAPQTVTDAVPVRRSDGAWRLVRTAVPIHLALRAALLRATIVGAGIPEGTVLMFPGAVPVRFDSPYLDLDPASTQIDFHPPATTELDPRLTDAGRRAAYAAVSAALTRCLNGDAAVAGRCPLPPGRYLPSHQHTRVVGSLADELSVTLLTSPDGVLEVSGTVRVRGTFRRLNFTNQVVTAKGTVDLSVAATAYAVAPLRLVWDPT